jgi:SAM-dependent methyltransferase
MDGYDDTTYGDAFADVYDEWYGGISDVDTTTAELLSLVTAGAVLELGVGTGRLSVPLALAGRGQGIVVSGLDTSRQMLDHLAQRDPDGLVRPMLGNMAGPLTGGPYELVFVAYNTLFNLTSHALQAACFRAVAEVLAPGGRFVVEAFVPDRTPTPSSDVSVRSIAADRVVLSVSTQDPEHQLAEGQFVEITEAGGVRLRPWSIRYSSPGELDEMATDVGFHVEHRWASFAREPFDTDSQRHVTVYRRSGSTA